MVPQSLVKQILAIATKNKFSNTAQGTGKILCWWCVWIVFKLPTSSPRFLFLFKPPFKYITFCWVTMRCGFFGFPHAALWGRWKHVHRKSHEWVAFSCSLKRLADSEKAFGLCNNLCQKLCGIIMKSRAQQHGENAQIQISCPSINLVFFTRLTHSQNLLNATVLIQFWANAATLPSQ